MKLLPSCKDITEESSDYLDHQLSFRRRLGFKLHLFLCVNCKRYVKQLKLTIATLGRMPSAAPPAMEEAEVNTIAARLQQVCKHHHHP